jgi:hypothetical protein
VDSSIIMTSGPLARSKADATVPDHKFVELVWPGKGAVRSTRQEPNGSWVLEEKAPDAERLYPFVELSRYPADAVAPRSMIIRGQRISALRTLGRALGRFVRLTYLDLPRIGVDDSEAAFQGDSAVVYSTWLSVVRTHLLAVEQLMRRDGVVVLHAGDTEEPYARLVANELFREQHVGTVVWQRSYAPRNMRGMREFTATHDYLLIYAKDKAYLPPVGLRRLPEGYSNADNDPRGPWKAEHKGAKTRRENSDFNTFVPPYRWQITEGRLPEGVWRLSPLTGVVFGIPLEVGTFPITIEVTDRAGKKAKRSFAVEILESGRAPERPALPWIFEEIQTTGRLRIETKALPTGGKGIEYSVACLAAGGEPYRAEPKRPGSGRYWEFARDTLLAAYQCDSVYLGRDEPTAIPHPKQYAPPEGELVIENQQTWWPGRVASGTNSTAFTGYTEDATKHLKALKELKLINTEVSAAKPEHLIARLINIFTDSGDTALEIFNQAGDFAAVSLKRGRNFVTLTGASDRDETLFEECVFPRLRSVVDGKDSALAERVSEIRMRPDAYIPFAGGGAFVVARVGAWFAERQKREDIASLNWEHYGESAALMEALLTSEGFVPASGNASSGVALNGEAIAYALKPDEFLTSELASEIATRAIEAKKRATIYYFRASTDFDANALPSGVMCKRVPFDLGL